MRVEAEVAGVGIASPASETDRAVGEAQGESTSRDVLAGAALGAAGGMLIGAAAGRDRAAQGMVVGALIGGGLGYASEVRRRLGFTLAQFARAINVSERTARTYDRPDKPLTEAQLRPIRELDRLREALCEVVDPSEVGPWMLRPNEAFGGSRPIDLIEGGQSDRLWRMVYYLESGSPG